MQLTSSSLVKCSERLCSGEESQGCLWEWANRGKRDRQAHFQAGRLRKIISCTLTNRAIARCQLLTALLDDKSFIYLSRKIKKCISLALSLVFLSSLNSNIRTEMFGLILSNNLTSDSMTMSRSALTNKVRAPWMSSTACVNLWYEFLWTSYSDMLV